MSETIKFSNRPIQAKMLCYARPDESAEFGFNLLLVEPVMKYWMSDTDICIDTVPVEYLPPNNMSREQLILKAIETMRDKQKQILARAEREVQHLEERINQLQLLTYQPQDNNVIDIQATKTGTDDDCPF